MFQMWRGFTGQDDYSHDYGWAPTIWAPPSCALDPDCEGHVHDFEITSVEFFEFNYSSKHDYEVGVNIFVEEYDTFRRMEDDFMELEGMQFNGRCSETCCFGGVG